jgi:hypothetical protein
MPPNANQAMAALREFARSITAGKREEPEAQSVATTAELASMPLPDAFACVRADLRNARRALEVQLALAMEDEPRDRARRVGIIQTYLADLTESEARLDATERTLAASSHAKS